MPIAHVCVLQVLENMDKLHKASLLQKAEATAMPGKEGKEGAVSDPHDTELEQVSTRRLKQFQSWP